MEIGVGCQSSSTSGRAKEFLSLTSNSRKKIQGRRINGLLQHKGPDMPDDPVRQGAVLSCRRIPALETLVV